MSYQFQSETITLATGDSTAAKQAKIDAVPRQAEPGVTVTFTFADGTHTGTATLNFLGFTYPIIIQGNTGDSAALSNAQSAIIDGDGFSGDVLNIQDCVNVKVSKIRILLADNAGEDGIYILNGRTIIEYCSIQGAAKTAANACIRCDDCTGYVIGTYVSNANHGIRCNRGIMQTNGNDDDTGSTACNYGLVSDGTLMKTGATQPAGTTANELAQNGGAIR